MLNVEEDSFRDYDCVVLNESFTSKSASLENYHVASHLKKIEGARVQEYERDEGSYPARIVDARDHL